MSIRFLSKDNARFLEALVAGLADPFKDDSRSSRTIDNGSDGIMPVTVARIGPDQFAVSHTYEQNGDLMRDPEIVFWRQFLPGAPGCAPGTKYGDQYRWAPIQYTQHNLGIDRELVEFEGGKPVRYLRHWQGDAATFCTDWFRNIRHQQGLSCSPTFPPFPAPDGDGAPPAPESPPDDSTPPAGTSDSGAGAAPAATLSYDDQCREGAKVLAGILGKGWKVQQADDAIAEARAESADRAGADLARGFGQLALGL